MVKHGAEKRVRKGSKVRIKDKYWNGISFRYGTVEDIGIYRGLRGLRIQILWIKDIRTVVPYGAVEECDLDVWKIGNGLDELKYLLFKIDQKYKKMWEK